MDQINNAMRNNNNRSAAGRAVIGIIIMIHDQV